MNTFTALFAAALLVGTGIHLWLLRRQAVHVGQHSGEVPATFAGRVSLEAHQKAADYTVANAKLGAVALGWDAVVTLTLSAGGGVDLIDRAWREPDLPSLTTGLGVLASVGVIGGLAGLPISIYRVFVIEQRFGFNRMTARLFVADMARNAVLLAILGLPLATAVLWLMGSMESGWWLAAWAVWMAFSLAITWAYPTLIAPRFNKFRPLENRELVERIERLLDRCGFASSGVFVMDGSRRSTHGNAYFTGLGRNKRIVFFDTLLDGLEPGEIEGVLAHELGHFRLRHILKQMALMAVASFAGLAILGWLVEQGWFYEAFQVGEPSRHTALALFLLTSPAFSFFFGPGLAWLSRRYESQADDFAGQHAGTNDLVSALVKLYEENASTLTPDPLHSAFFDGHPPPPVRIRRLLETMGR